MAESAKRLPADARVTELLKVQPQPYVNAKFDTQDATSLWHFQLREEEFEKPIDFIHVLLDMLEPSFDELASLGIKRNNILIWLVYEYQDQCAMELHPWELERLGRSKVGFTIDCHRVDEMSK